MSKITFIIPTIGRNTLQKSLSCLLNQTNNEWNAIVIFDGIEPNIDINDERILVLKTSKLGKGHNSAGNVRNYGIKYVKTEWIAFLDDDDAIKNNYVDIFLNEISNYTTDLIIFRMIDNKYIILPKHNTDNFYEGSVGISFAVKKKVLDTGIIFEPSHLEDYYLLSKVRENKYKIMISPYLLYFVRNYNIDSCNILSNRVFIN
jgi:glycosyltransferase involved in cell wall biosynthesis